VLREAPLVRVVEILREGVDLKLDRYEVEVAPGGEAEVKVLVERIGGFTGDVTLSADFGEVSPASLRLGDESPSAEVSWRLRVPEGIAAGEYSYELRACSGDRVLKSVRLRVAVRPRGRYFSGVPRRGDKVAALEVEVSALNLKPIRILSDRLGSELDVEEARLEVEAEVQDRRPRVRLELSDVTLDDVKALFPSISGRYGIMVKRMYYRLKLKPRKGEYVVFPELSESEAKELEGAIRLYYLHEG